MKNILPIIFTLFVFVSYAQLDKGNKFIGGSASINISDGDNQSLRDSTIRDYFSSSYGWSISPDIGFFVKDNLAFGGGITFGATNNEYESISDDVFSFSTSKSKSTGFYIFTRKYFPIKNRFGCFVQGNLNYSFRNSEGETRLMRSSFSPTEKAIDDSRQQNYAGGISFNLYYFVLKKFTLETNLFGLRYNHTRNSSDSQISRDPQIPIEFSSQESTQNSFGFSILNNFSFDRVFTINYYF